MSAPVIPIDELVEEVEAYANKPEDIRVLLLQKGYDVQVVEAVVRHVQSKRFERQRKLGFKLLIVGALLCAGSCIFTFFHDFNAVYTGFSLYGLTSLGAMLVLIGLGMVLGL